MTTYIKGNNYDGPLDEILNENPEPRVIHLGNNTAGDNVWFTLRDTPRGTEWRVPGPRAKVMLTEGTQAVPSIEVQGLFAGGENRKLVFEHPTYQNRIEVTYSRPERR